MVPNTTCVLARSGGIDLRRVLQAILRPLLAGATILLASTAFACTSTSSDGAPVSSDVFWVLPVTEGMTRLPDSCTEAVESVIKATVARPVSRIELIAYADPVGSASFGLAQVSRFAGQLREALLQRSPKMKIRIETRLLPTLGADTGKPALGRIMVRVPFK